MGAAQVAARPTSASATSATSAARAGLVGPHVMSSSGSDAPSHPGGGNAVRNAVMADMREREREQRQRVVTLDDNRTKLLGAAEELRDAAKQEDKESEQLRRRIETLRKECYAMKTAIDAARESCERQQGRFE